MFDHVRRGQINPNDNPSSRAAVKTVILFILLTSVAFNRMYSQAFAEFVARVESAPDSASRYSLIQEFFSYTTLPVVEGDTVYFLYRGGGSAVAVPGEMNRWNPSDALMQRIRGTNVWYRGCNLPRNGRVEYKIWVDSTWTLDPLNPKKSRGGYGENSDLWMPEYVPRSFVDFDTTIPHGTIDTVWLQSKILRRKHPVFVYVPSGAAKKRLPTVYVTDGGDYLSLAKMNNILDHLIAAKKIEPVLGVFVDPRTDLRDASTNKRMEEYAASDRYVDFLQKELVPYVEKHYPARKDPKRRLVMGASMGGLISTYIVLKRPGFIANAAAQSPAYFQADGAVIKLVKRIKKPRGNFYVDTGTINDTENEARLVKDLLEDKHARLRYLELPEGHNWYNWRARLATILEHFFSPR